MHVVSSSTIQIQSWDSFRLVRTGTPIFSSRMILSFILKSETSAQIDDNYQSPPLWCSVQGGSRTSTLGVHQILEPDVVTSGSTSSTSVLAVEESYLL
ncbi:hypothetical protein V6N11_077216 [Hibiscus sabdariffa]|uniref:Uncharacterized protein n=1 Tax=Hibiscus sabdariffa TaxID=183260 RepID=A0ABR2TD92_9ROSI